MIFAVLPGRAKRATDAFDRGIAHLDNGVYELAAAEFRRAIRHRRDHAAAYYLRAVAHRAMTDYRGAAADFDQSARLAAAGAVGEFKEAMAWQRDGATALYNRGLAYHNEGDHGRAISNYSEAIAIKPGWAAALLARGIALKERDRNNPHGKGFDDRSYALPSDCVSAADDFHAILSLETDQPTKTIARCLFDELTAPGTPGHEIRRRWSR